MRGISVLIVFFVWLTVWFGFTQLPSSPPFSPPACTLSVDAGRDTTLCQAGQQVVLNATPSESILAVRWSPAALLNDSTSLRPRATIDRTTTFRATVYSVLPQNLVLNGDFSMGNFGFRSDYRYGNSTSRLGILADENQYAVDDDPTNAHIRFASCSDHTSGKGNMMIVNASGQANNVWCQTIQVEPDKDYVVSAWIASAVTQNPARLRFTINGATIGQEISAGNTTCNWRQFYALWHSGPSTLAEICIQNNNLTAQGNDFLLDDISFSPVCVATDSVTVRIADLNADWTPPLAFCQNEPAFALETLLAPRATPGGQWTLDGQPAVAIDPARLTPGTHSLSYRVQDGACSAERTAAVTVAATPSAGLALPELRLCAGTDTLLNLVDRLRNADPGGTWAATNVLPGGVFDATTTALRTRDLPSGTYSFTYRLEAPPPCQGSEATVIITIDPAPAADAGEDQALDCVVQEVGLGGPGTTAGAGIQLQWTGPDGSFLGSDPFPEVNRPGAYVLTAINTQTGCRATDEVLVASNITTPEPVVSIRPITCYGDSDGAILIDEVRNGDGPFVYGLDNGPMTPKNQFENLGPGRYLLTVEDLNGCTNSVEVVIEQPTELVVGLNVTLPGDNPLLPLGDSTTLRVQTSIPDEQVAAVSWTPAMDSCRNCLSMRVAPVIPTTYAVTVTDQNGCQASASLLLQIAKQKNVFIPNAFSPNNDGINDVLMIYAGNEVAKVRYFRILSRWGTVVYSAEDFSPNDPNYGWNGYFRGQRMRNGVFVYTAELELVNGKVINVSGDVTLVN